MEALDRCMETVESAAKSELTNSSKDPNILGVSITTLKLLFGSGDWLSAWMVEAMFITVAAKLSVQIIIAVVTIILNRVSLI